MAQVSDRKTSFNKLIRGEGTDGDSDNLSGTKSFDAPSVLSDVKSSAPQQNLRKLMMSLKK